MVNDHDAVIVGVPAVVRRSIEMGTDRPPTPTRIELDAAGLDSIIRRTREFFGPVLSRLEARIRRGAAHSATPPKNQHRLSELVSNLLANKVRIEQGEREVDVHSALELAHAVNTYESWRQDPNYATFATAVEVPHNFRHDIVVLTAARFMANAGLGVEFVPTKVGGGRSHDLKLAVSLGHVFAAEVKAPDLVAEIDSSGVSDRGRRLIREALRDSAEQLPPNQPGLLVLGGPYWHPVQLEHLEAEAESLCRERGARHPLFAAIMVLSTTAMMQPRPGRAPREWSDFEFRLGIDGRWIANPNYTGDLRLAFDRNLVGPFDISFRP